MTGHNHLFEWIRFYIVCVHICDLWFMKLPPNIFGKMCVDRAVLSTNYQAFPSKWNTRVDRLTCVHPFLLIFIALVSTQFSWNSFYFHSIQCKLVLLQFTHLSWDISCSCLFRLPKIAANHIHFRVPYLCENIYKTKNVIKKKKTSIWFGDFIAIDSSNNWDCDCTIHTGYVLS